MKIVYLMDQLYLHGGAEKIISQKLNSLVEDYKCEVYLLTTEQKSKPYVYEVSKKVKRIDLGINYQRKLSYFHLINLFKIVKHFFKLKKTLENIKPNVVISVSQTPDQFFLPFICKDIPKIKEFHSSGVNYIKPTSFIQKMKYQLFLLYRKYSALVLLNNDEKIYYPFNNLVVIPNFIIEKTYFKKLSYKKKNIIIAAGRIATVKQFDHLIKAWSLIAIKFPHWEVHIYGDGDEVLSSELQQLIKELKVSNIKLKGVTSHLNEKMKKASIYAMTSKTECFPMVLLESLSCGLPIVSYNCPFGPKNIITNKKDGILVNHNNIDIFASELTQLIKNTELRKKMEINARNNVKRFDEKIVMQQWIQLFKSID